MRSTRRPCRAGASRRSRRGGRLAQQRLVARDAVVLQEPLLAHEGADPQDPSPSSMASRPATPLMSTSAAGRIPPELQELDEALPAGQHVDVVAVEQAERLLDRGGGVVRERGRLHARVRYSVEPQPLRRLLPRRRRAFLISGKTERSSVVTSGQSSSTRLPAGRARTSARCRRAARTRPEKNDPSRGSPAPARASVRRLVVVDVDADVVVRRRGRVALEQVQLEVAEAQVLDRERERVGRDLLHPEDLGVEAHRALEVARDEADVVEPCGPHGLPSTADRTDRSTLTSGVLSTVTFPGDNLAV